MSIRQGTIVRYHGSRTELHGALFRLGDGVGERWDLVSQTGARLYRVRRSSFTVVDVPRLTERRALALEAVELRHHTPIGARERNWLIRHELIERDPEGRLVPTRLGFELYGAVRFL